MHSFRRSLRSGLCVALLAWTVIGCASSHSADPAPPATPANTESVPPATAETALPPRAGASETGADGYLRVVAGAGDSVGALISSRDNRYLFRFKQTLPASSQFNFQDRELSFFFRPTLEAVHFQVENRLNRPVVIDWERSAFLRATGGPDKIAHATTRWDDRFRSQTTTQIGGLQRYSDYVFPISSLVDPGGRDIQLHRVLFPEDEQAVQFVDREFGFDLAVEIDGRPVTYAFRFRVASVIPQ
ncbi:MAG: hypothetical protein HOP12_04090 [Candidatus Eisenbacteria bacterium]|uniref:DUF3108 domain-containing protein n=1 Tax=Eiseniibacteriota bacterium TaxID=2212470 RepID=A0A849SIC0_UNCEI|nr:hypothetical protein [Candidatus Eisenbacteria bacterium]